jgi:hypothetical protein
LASSFVRTGPPEVLLPKPFPKKILLPHLDTVLS